jgi:glycosyltransferase involved in cell wall biosynthesis
MPLKVLQIINGFNMGGAEQMAKRLAMNFDPDRVRSDIWSISSFVDPAIENRFTADLDASGIPHLCLGKKPRRKDPRCIAAMVRRMRAKHYDIVHMHCDSPAFYGRIAATLTPGTKRIVTIHCHMSKAAVFRERFLFWMTDKYVACSSEVESDLRERCNVADSRFVRILNGIEADRTRRVAMSRDDIRARYHIAPDEIVALVVGRLSQQKAQLDLVDTLTCPGELIQRLAVWMVGDDTGPYADQVRDAIAEKQLDGRVRIFGMVDDNVIDELIKGADLFLLPSLHEGMSVAILEALGSGLPTVISDLENNREITDGGRVAWLISPSAPRKLAESLERILASPDDMKRRARDAMLFVEENFCFERVVREHTELYESLTE